MSPGRAMGSVVVKNPVRRMLAGTENGNATEQGLDQGNASEEAVNWQDENILGTEMSVANAGGMEEFQGACSRC